MAEREIPDIEIPKRERRAWVRLSINRFDRSAESWLVVGHCPMVVKHELGLV